jgi:hypothetical protein
MGAKYWICTRIYPASGFRSRILVYYNSLSSNIKMKFTTTIASAAMLMFTATAYAGTIKLFYNENGTRGWKGGHKSVEACEKAARSNRLSSTQYYCSERQDYEKERRLGWRK